MRIWMQMCRRPKINISLSAALVDIYAAPSVCVQAKNKFGSGWFLV